MELFKYDTVSSHMRNQNQITTLCQIFSQKSREIILYLNCVVIVGGQDWSIKYSNYIPKDRHNFLY